jgi:AcrR family transcriptional regulator
LRSAYRLLKKACVQKISTQQIAHAAGVSTATIYRWWPNKESLLLDAFLQRSEDAAPLKTEGGSPLQRLREHVLQLAHLHEGEHGRLASRLLVAIQDNKVLRDAYFHRLYQPKINRIEAVLQDAVAKREIPPEVNTNVFMNAIFGPIIIQLLFRHELAMKIDMNDAFDFAVNGALASSHSATVARA